MSIITSIKSEILSRALSNRGSDILYATELIQGLLVPPPREGGRSEKSWDRCELVRRCLTQPSSSYKAAAAAAGVEPALDDNDILVARTLCIAAHRGYADVVGMLLEEFEPLGFARGEALVLAVSRGHEDAVKLLLRHGVSPSYLEDAWTKVQADANATARTGSRTIARLIEAESRRQQQKRQKHGSGIFSWFGWFGWFGCIGT